MRKCFWVVLSSIVLSGLGFRAEAGVRVVGESDKGIPAQVSTEDADASEGRSKANVKYGVQLGMGYTMAKDKSDYPMGEIGGIYGMHVGGLVNVSFNRLIGMEVGLNLTNRGNTLKYDTDTVAVKKTFLVYYMQVPFLFDFHYPFNEKIALTAQAGIYGALGVYSTYKRHFDELNGYEITSESRDLKLHNVKYSPDCGLKFAIGPQWEHLRLAAQLDWGFTEYLYKKDYLTRYYCVAVSYLF